MPQKVSLLRVMCLRLAARPDGMHVSEIQGEKERLRANTLIGKLVRRGVMHKGVVNRANNVRYFSTARDRDVYMARVEAQTAPTKSKGEAKVKVFLPHAGLPRVIANWPANEPVDYSHAKVTPCPNYTPRFQAVDYPGLLGCQRGRA
jgi:hypothetical protein